MQKCLIFVLAAFAIATLWAASSSPPPIATNISNFTQWLPIIVLAVTLSVGIVALYYILGVLLNNSQMRAGAISEFGEAIATIIIVVIILAAFNFVGNATYASAVIPTSTTQAICTQLQNATLNFISTNSTLNSPAQQVCSSLINSANSSDLTRNLDYPLASTYLIVANLTNQSATNLNAIYIVNSLFNFLGNFRASDSICVPNITCLLPTPVGLTAAISFQPFQGYTSISYTMRIFTPQATLIFTSFIVQLIGIIVMLFIWPYLLAAGIILRSTFFTRKLGGLLIAICIAGVLVFPVVFLAQYAGLNNVNLVPIGSNSFSTNSSSSNSIPVLTLFGTDNNGSTVAYNTNTINFYVFPRADYVIRHAGCWPTGGLLGQELIVIGAYAIPIVGLGQGLSNLVGSISGSTTTALIPGFNCNTAAAINTLFALANVYGLMSIIGLLFPLFDLLIGISAVLGLSSLLGGTTNLIGLNRLI